MKRYMMFAALLGALATALVLLLTSHDASSHVNHNAVIREQVVSWYRNGGEVNITTLTNDLQTLTRDEQATTLDATAGNMSSLISDAANMNVDASTLQADAQTAMSEPPPVPLTTGYVNAMKSFAVSAKFVGEAVQDINSGQLTQAGAMEQLASGTLSVAGNDLQHVAGQASKLGT